MKLLFKPAVNVFDSLKCGQKFSFTGLIILIPFAVTLYLLLSELNSEIKFAQGERMGLEYNILLRDILEEIQLHRGITIAMSSGEMSFGEGRSAVQSHIEGDITAIDIVDQKYGSVLNTAERWHKIKSEWGALKSRVQGIGVKKGFDAHTAIIEDLLALIAHVGNTSNLKFDPHPDSYYLMDSIVVKLPALSENLGQARAIGSAAAAKKTITDDERARIAVLYGLIKSSVDANRIGLETALHENPALRPRLADHVNDSAAAINKLLEVVNKDFIKGRRIDINTQDYFKLATKAIESVFRIYDAASPELDRLLRLRIDSISQRRNLAWAVAIIAFLTVTYLFIAFFISVAVPLKKITGFAQRIASGDLNVNIGIKSKDEVGILANVFNEMALNLKKSREDHFRLYKEERQKSQQMTLLHEIVAAIASDLTLEPLLERLASHTASLLNAELSALAVLHPETGEIEFFKANIPSDNFPVKQMPQGKGLFSAVLRTGAALRLEDASADPRFEGLPAGHPFIKGILAVPLLSKNKIIGGLFVANKHGSAAFTHEDEELLMILGLQSATAVENARLYTKAAEMAATDSLTGLANRRTFMEELNREVMRAKRYQQALSLLIVDIDHFKWVNDKYGHLAGDAVLQSLAQILIKHVRTVDMIGRYGGDEFAVILPETNASGAKLVGENVRRTVSHTSFLLPDRNEIGLTVSIGISSFPDNANLIQQLIERADQALYMAKEKGRNQVFQYSETLVRQIEDNPDEIAKLLNADLKNIIAIIAALNIKTSFFRKHSEKVRHYSILLSDALHLSDAEKEALSQASLLHDIGLGIIPNSILRKPKPFTPEEWSIMKQHPATGAKIIENVPALRHLAPIIHSHHERYDGAGYPDGLKGEAIPYLARALAVADAYAAMTSGLPWYTMLTKEEALTNLKAAAGSQYDPEIVKAFCRIEDI